jgi:hypothetical protein
MSGGMEDMSAKEIIQLAAEDVAVNNPPHYNQGKVECIDAIEAALTPEEFRGYLKGNVIKYVWREKQKHGNSSLAKGEWYLKRLLKEKAPTKGPKPGEVVFCKEPFPPRWGN